MNESYAQLVYGPYTGGYSIQTYVGPNPTDCAFYNQILQNNQAQINAGWTNLADSNNQRKVWSDDFQREQDRIRDANNLIAQGNLINQTLPVYQPTVEPQQPVYYSPPVQQQPAYEPTYQPAYEPAVTWPQASTTPSKLFNWSIDDKSTAKSPGVFSKFLLAIPARTYKLMLSLFRSISNFWKKPKIKAPAPGGKDVNPTPLVLPGRYDHYSPYVRFPGQSDDSPFKLPGAINAEKSTLKLPGLFDTDKYKLPGSIDEFSPFILQGQKGDGDSDLEISLDPVDDTNEIPGLPTITPTPLGPFSPLAITGGLGTTEGRKFGRTLGHTIKKHVGKSIEFLVKRAIDEERETVGTFVDEAEAEREIGLLLDEKKEEVRQWLASGKWMLVLTSPRNKCGFGITISPDVPGFITRWEGRGIYCKLKKKRSHSGLPYMIESAYPLDHD
jgi:hypothetical protein